MRRRYGNWSGWHGRAALTVLLVSAVSGCGKPGGTVTGHVRCKGETVTAGTVFFYGPDDQVVITSINSDGSYTATKVPLGPVKVAVTTPTQMPAEMVKNIEKMRKGKFTLPATKTVSVPDQYGKPEQSGLELTVAKGSQFFEIDLK